MKQLFRASLITIALASTTVGRTTEPMLLPEVAAGLEQAIARGDARAVAVGLFDNGETKVIGLGRLSRDTRQPPQGDTVFEIGSITKVFTSLLTQVQVDDGRIGWDDSIGSRLPRTQFRSDAVASIKLRELASHSSGLPRLPDNMNPADPLNPYEGYGRGQLLSFLSRYDPDSLAKEYAYSNLGAGLLGEIAAYAAGSTGRRFCG